MAKPDEAPDRLQLTKAPADLARLHPWLDESAARHNLTAKLLEAMHIALEEAVMNVAMHAVLPADAPEILVQFTAGTGLAEMVIEDAGQEFNPVTAPERPRPKSLAEAEPGGMGLKLLRRYCTNMRYERTGGRNRLTLRFPVGAR
jgi:anti-sigma regulatory factor (Ser/Thr protein kinase)